MTTSLHNVIWIRKPVDTIARESDGPRRIRRGAVRFWEGISENYPEQTFMMMPPHLQEPRFRKKLKGASQV